jgi:PEP-CTERM motif
MTSNDLRRKNARLRDQIAQVLEKDPEPRDVTEGIALRPPCWSGNDTGGPGALCSNPDQYLFWDSGHPTAEGHLLVAQDACNVIGACNAVDARPLLVAQDPRSAVPEPSTWAMMLLGFAGLGFLGYRKICKGTLAAA